MTDMERRGRATEAFFGRRTGTALREQQAEPLNSLLPAFLIDLSAAPPEPLTSLFPVPVKTLRLEIGFGGGEHLMHRALETPSTGFIGVDTRELPAFDDQKFALDLLEQKHVLVAPGVSFNVPYRNHFRVTTLPDPAMLREVFARIEELLQSYASAAVAGASAPEDPPGNVVEATSRFK